MWTKSIAFGTLALLSIGGLGACGAAEPQDGDTIAESTALAADTEIALERETMPRRLRCGGYADVKCPRGFVCVMDRDDGAGDFGYCMRRRPPPRCECGRDEDGGERCGRSICGPGEYCCNRSCSICAPRGGSCTQQFCE